MTVVNLVNEPQGVITGNDNIVIVNYFDGIRGGRSLDLTGYTEKFVKAGHILIETSDGKIQPLPVSEEHIPHLAMNQRRSIVGFS